MPLLQHIRPRQQLIPSQNQILRISASLRQRDGEDISSGLLLESEPSEERLFAVGVHEDGDLLEGVAAAEFAELDVDFLVDLVAAFADEFEAFDSSDAVAVGGEERDADLHDDVLHGEVRGDDGDGRF